MNDGLRRDRHLLVAAERGHKECGRGVQGCSQHHYLVDGDRLAARLDVGYHRAVEPLDSQLSAALGKALSTDALTLPQPLDLAAHYSGWTVIVLCHDDTIRAIVAQRQLTG